MPNGHYDESPNIRKFRVYCPKCGNESFFETGTYKGEDPSGTQVFCRTCKDFTKIVAVSEFIKTEVEFNL